MDSMGMTGKWTRFFALGALALLLTALAPLEESQVQTREQALQEFQNGNYKSAFELYAKLARDPADAADQIGPSLQQAVNCLTRLNRVNEADVLIEDVLKIHAGNWRLRVAAAEACQGLNHYGFIIAGEFERGQHRGGGQYANALERDRVRSLQLLLEARRLLPETLEPAQAGSFYHQLAEQLLQHRTGNQSWRLQYMTELETLPDYEEGYRHAASGTTGAPVDAEGGPVYYKVPESFETAQSDGERWRWALAQAAELNPGLSETVQFEIANFYYQQWGVQTLVGYNFGWGWGGAEDAGDREKAAYAVHTLGEDESLARLAGGIKRFKMPDEANYIRIFRELDQRGKSYADTAQRTLAQIFENRRQYPKAAEFWNKYKQGERVEQITGNWGQFLPVMTQPAATGQGATVEFRFRNAKEVAFTAREIKVEQLLRDVRNYISSKPNQLDWNKIQVENIGWRLIQNNEWQYLGDAVAEWKEELQPRENHFDRRVTIQTPLQKAGAYFLSAELPGGNKSHIVIWLDDAAILQKNLNGEVYFFIADARTGAPLAKASVDFFGFNQVHVRDNRFQTRIFNVDAETSADGELFLQDAQLPHDYQWLIAARTQDGRRAHLGFQSVWYGKHYDYEYSQIKPYAITDRPVYRPNQAVKFKYWVRRAQYDMEDRSDFAHQSFSLQIYDPKNEKIFEKSYTADKYGGFDGEFTLAEDATLGVYRMSLANLGGHQTFRVEEYKKPEFEVSVESPQEPVMLGESFEAKVEARYYFGEAVKKGTVKYKVTRESYNANWFPWGYWDWFYGPGYWWFAYDYPWYPGWARWGCRMPWPWWWPNYRHDPPEVVLEQELEIPADGKLSVKVDTALAQAIHGDQDHQYNINVEVTDESRRTIVGSGRVLVAREPFKVYAWVDRGHYRPGDTVEANFFAQTLDNNPVQGKGVLRLLNVTYDKERKPVEQTVQKWDLDTNEEGRAQMSIKASAAGQYRLSYTVTDAKKHEIEGGYIFNIVGAGKDADNFRFNDLELIPDAKEYAPGNKVKLLVNTNQPESTVLLFVRPANSVYLRPKVLRLSGQSVVEEIEVVKKDMPNFFVEAVTISGAKVHEQNREIIVPPQQRVLNVTIEPSKEEYKPGEAASVKVHVTDREERPVVGSVVLSVYDKALEYISGGTNVEGIREFFWKWRRSHFPQTQTSLQRVFANMLKQNEKGLVNLGVFGHLVDFDDADGTMLAQTGAEFEERLGGARMQRGMVGGEMAMAAPMAAVMEGAALADESFAVNGAKQFSHNAIREEQPAQPEAVEPVVRTHFADTAYWNAFIQTDEEGNAEVKFDMPENLTGWKVKSWALTHGTKVGEAAVEVVTKKNLLLRMQAPRFFVEKDEVVLSANVHNYLKTEKKVDVGLILLGQTLEIMDEQTLPAGPGDPEQRPVIAIPKKIVIPAGGEQRVDWRVKVVREGEAVIRMNALTDEESDAMELRFPVYVHGMDKQVAYSGQIRPEHESAKIAIEVPEQRRIDETRLQVNFTPTLAGAMVDALPYLLDYPYGCTEQTLSRFLPAVLTQKILLEMKLNLEEIGDKRTNLNAQELGDPGARAAQWKRFPANPVFDTAEMEKIVDAGLTKILNMQLSDGGWGWFSGYGEHSYPHTTAYVVHSLQLAQRNGLDVPQDAINRGIEWLKKYQREEIAKLDNWPKDVHPRKQYADNLDAFVFMVLIDADQPNQKMLDFLYRDRTQLALYGKAMFGLALYQLRDREKLDMLVENIEQFLVLDAENQTAYLNMGNAGYWWYWYGSEIEAHAYYLKLLARIEPTSDKAAWLVKYLLNNRKHASYWNSTRDTAICVEALAEYWRASGEDEPELTIEVWFDGQKKKEVQVTRENLFTFDNRLMLSGQSISGGKHVIELRKQGKGPLYYNAYISYFSLEDFITKAGLEIKVERKYYKLVPEDKQIKVAGAHGQAVDQKVEKYRRAELADLAQLVSGDLVEIELTLESKNDYEYLVFEDMKAAGFEPVAVQSGYTNNGLGAYMELRDNRVAFFLRQLARGKNSIAYRMRAEIPGRFSALPARGYAMYAPELRANSDEIRLLIEEK